MANIVETVNYDSGVYLLATNDPVLGGTSGKANAAATNLANRTAWLKSQVDTINALTPTLAPLLSPTLTGTPKTAAPLVGDNSTQISTTAFVQLTANGRLPLNVAGSANVTLSATQAGYAFIEFLGALTGNIVATVPGSASLWKMKNSTTGAFTITIKSATAGGTTFVLPQGGSQDVLTDGTNVYPLGYLPVTGGTIAPTGAPLGSWTALNAPTLRVTDAGNGSSGGLSIESYQPTIQFIDWSAGAKNSRVMQNAGQILFSNDTAGEGTFLAAGVSLSPDGYMSVGAGSLSNNVSYYAQGPTVGTGATQYGFYHVAEFNSTATANGYAFAAAPKVKDAAFTMAQLTGFLAATPTVGASATVTTYAAFNAKDFSGAGSVYGFRGQIAAGTNKWNLYNDGSALNYLNGKLLVGTNIDDGYSKLQVSGVVKGVAAQKAIVASNGSGTGQTSMYLTREGAATDEKNWEILHSSANTFVIRSIDDAYSTSQNALAINRPTGGGVALTTMQLMSGGGRVLVGTTTDDGASTLQLGTGNLAFTGASQRITGDFTNATFASRAYLQTSTTNGTTSVGVIPNGTGASANFAAYSAANPTNASRIVMTALSGEARITADNVGTGTLPALTFYANAAERMRVSTSGRVLVNTTTDTGIGQLQVTGGIATSTYDAQGANVRINGGAQDVILRADASNFYLLLASAAGGSFNTLRPFSFNLATGALSLDGTGVGTSHGGGVWSTAAAAKVPGTGVFRSQGEIGGAFVDWNSGTPRAYALQVDAPTQTSAYGGIRWTRWAGRHLAAIDAYEGGTTSSQPLIVMHVANQNNAWTFSNSDITRGAGGTVYGTWNLNPANYLPVAGGWMNGQLTMGNASTILLQGQGNTYSASLRADSSGMVGFINNAQNAFNLQISDAGYVTVRGGATFGARPTWAGLFPWDSGNSAGSFGTNGYQRLGSGLLVQWGLGTAGANAASVLNYFPIAFPGFCAHVTAAHVGTDATVNIILDANYQGNVNAFGARSNYGAANVGIYWIAVGW